MKRSIISLAIVVTLAFLGRPAVAAEPAAAPQKVDAAEGGRCILVYKVDEKRTVWTSDKMDSLVDAISKRVNRGARKDISVRGLGADKVEISMPLVSGGTAAEKQARSEEIRKLIRSTGALYFRIVANNRDNAALIELAKAERKKSPAEPPAPVKIFDATGKKELAKWCRVRDQEVDKLRDEPAAMKVGEITTKDKEGGDVKKDAWEVLVLSPESEAYDVTGCDIRDARAEKDPETNLPEVSFSFNLAGGAKFGRLTGDHVPVGNFKYHLAIVLDDVVETAPAITSMITDNGRITGNFTAREVEQFVAIINAGSLPAALEATPVSETISPGPGSK